MHYGTSLTTSNVPLFPTATPQDKHFAGIDILSPHLHSLSLSLSNGSTAREFQGHLETIANRQGNHVRSYSVPVPVQRVFRLRV